MINIVDLYDPFINWCGFMRLSMWTALFSSFIIQAQIFRNSLDAHNQIESNFSVKKYVKSFFTDYIIVIISWVLVEGMIGYLTCFLNTFKSDAGIFSDCHTFITNKDCAIEPKMKFITSLLYIFLVFQIIIGIYYLYVANCNLKKRSYAQIRWINVSFRYHSISIIYVGDFVSWSILLLWFTEIDTCVGYLMTWFGFVPAQMAMSLYAVINSILYMPSYQMSLRSDYNCENNLSWNEDDVVDSLHHNNDINNNSQLKNHYLEDNHYKKNEFLRLFSRKQHIIETCEGSDYFCFELAMKLYYWSEVSYEYNERTDACNEPFDLDLAKNLFNLMHHKYFWFKKWDIHVVISWNHHTVLISFRGTYSVSNVFADIMCWRVTHMPQRGNYFQRTRPLIHHGFHECWIGDNLNFIILNQVIEIITSDEFNRKDIQVMVTGHSLGGALAILAAYDIKKYCGIPENQILCYTFGAPRVGNHAFVRDYIEHIPNTWQIINDMDVVPRALKFFILYKHTGKRVLINELGDMIVCPYFVELTLKTNYSQTFPFYYLNRSNVLKHHRLCNYKYLQHTYLNLNLNF